jgi:hypothetical protein
MTPALRLSTMAAAAALCVLATACGSEASPSNDSSNNNGNGTAGDPLCPLGIEASYSSIDAKIFRGASCAACHTPSGAATAGGLDLASDAYAALVNVTANNSRGTAEGLARVKPGDTANSLLWQKINSTGSTQYGNGMPLNTPGRLCEATKTAIRQWIEAGAPRN